MDTCYSCGADRLVRLEDSFSITYKGQVLSVTTPYELCHACGEESIPKALILEGERIIRHAKRSADNLYLPDEIKGVRKFLNLTQDQAATLFGGGRNAFSKYERDEVTQSVAMDNLLKICVKYSAVFEDLKNSTKIKSESWQTRIGMANLSAKIKSKSWQTMIETPKYKTVRLPMITAANEAERNSCDELSWAAQ